MSNHTNPGQLLNKFFQLKKEVFPQLSLRRLAQLIEISPSHLSRILQGKKKFPDTKLNQLSKALSLDEVQVKVLKEALLYEDFKQNEEKLEQLNELAVHRSQNKISSLSKYKELEDIKRDFMSHWYNIAIMDLTTCSNFQFNYQWIAKKLNLSIQEVKESIKKLIEEKLLKVENGQLVKETKNLRVSVLKSKNHIRQFHHSMITKALWTLNNKQDEASLGNRLITGITIATNPQQIEKAKEKLTIALHDIAEILSTGECTEVYQLNLQLFGITESDDKIDPSNSVQKTILPNSVFARVK